MYKKFLEGGIELLFSKNKSQVPWQNNNNNNNKKTRLCLSLKVNEEIDVKTW